jgi:hypothetical protein
MKRFAPKLLVFLILVFSAAATTASSQINRRVRPVAKPAADVVPAGDELRCRGGSYLGNSDFLFFEKVGSQVSATGEATATISMRFMGTSKYTDAVYGSGGERGDILISDRHWEFRGASCTWLSKIYGIPYEPLSRGEPRLIHFETSENAQLRQQLHGTPLDTSPTAAERFPDAQSIPAYMKDPNHYWTFFVVNTNQGYFQATEHHYWKPNLEQVRAIDSKRANKADPHVLK